MLWLLRYVLFILEAKFGRQFSLISCFWLKQYIFHTMNIIERRKYIILLIRAQETFQIYNVEPTNSMFQEIEVSHCVTVM